MKCIQFVNKENHVVDTRKIDQNEWDEFYNKMEQVDKDTKKMRRKSKL